MDVSRFVVESAAFTRETLLGKPSRWLIFILLGLPWMALSSRAESWKILEGTTIHWNLIPWQEAGLLIGAGVLCNFLGVQPSGFRWMSNWMISSNAATSAIGVFSLRYALLVPGLALKSGIYEGSRAGPINPWWSGGGSGRGR
jgi:hypothetical protein